MRGHSIATFRAVQMALESDTFLPATSMELFDGVIGWRQGVTLFEASESKDTNIQCLVLRRQNKAMKPKLRRCSDQLSHEQDNLIEKTSTRNKSASCCFAGSEVWLEREVHRADRMKSRLDDSGLISDIAACPASLWVA